MLTYKNEKCSVHKNAHSSYPALVCAPGIFRYHKAPAHNRRTSKRTLLPLTTQTFCIVYWRL